jgi:hypothetical protein
MTASLRRTAVAGVAALALGTPIAVQATGWAAAADTGYGARLTSARYLSGEAVKLTGEVTCSAGHTWVLQIQARQRSGAFGAQTTDGTCTGELQTFEVLVTRMQLEDPLPLFHRGRVTTSIYGGSYLCDETGGNELNLANDVKQNFTLR